MGNLHGEVKWLGQVVVSKQQAWNLNVGRHWHWIQQKYLLKPKGNEWPKESDKHHLTTGDKGEKKSSMLLNTTHWYGLSVWMQFRAGVIACLCWWPEVGLRIFNFSKGWNKGCNLIFFLILPLLFSLSARERKGVEELGNQDDHFDLRSLCSWVVSEK